MRRLALLSLEARQLFLPYLRIDLYKYYVVLPKVPKLLREASALKYKELSLCFARRTFSPIV